MQESDAWTWPGGQGRTAAYDRTRPRQPKMSLDSIKSQLERRCFQAFLYQYRPDIKPKVCRDPLIGFSPPLGRVEAVDVSTSSTALARR